LAQKGWEEVKVRRLEKMGIVKNAGPGENLALILLITNE